jgi:hypothetical protein
MFNKENKIKIKDKERYKRRFCAPAMLLLLLAHFI